MAELTFAGFPPTAFEWYEALADNNDKAWFKAHRDTFEAAVKAPLAALLGEGAATFGGTVKLSRPHRDVRFSREKTPYKTSLFGGIHPSAGAGAGRGSGLYASISAEGVTAAAGYHEMAADQLARFRAALDDAETAAPLERELASARKTLELRGRSLKTAPKGFARDHPRLDLLRMKELILLQRFAPAACGEGLREKVFSTWRAALPVMAWLDCHVGPPEPAERSRP